jgi:hypothetical protein
MVNYKQYVFGKEKIYVNTKVFPSLHSVCVCVGVNPWGSLVKVRF